MKITFGTNAIDEKEYHFFASFIKKITQQETIKSFHDEKTILK